MNNQNKNIIFIGGPDDGKTMVVKSHIKAVVIARIRFEFISLADMCHLFQRGEYQRTGEYDLNGNEILTFAGFDK